MKNYSSSFTALIERNPMLSADEQRELVIKAQGGDARTREKLLVTNLRFVIDQAQAFEHHRFNQSLEMDDLIIDGLDGLNYAIDKFDTSFNVPFIGYAKNWISERIRADIQNNGSLVYVPKNRKDEVQFNLVSLDASCSGSTDDELCTFGAFIADEVNRTPAENYERQELHEVLLSAIAEAAKEDDRLVEIFTAHYNLDGKGRHSFATIGKMLGISAQRTQQLHQDALKRFRTQPLICELYSSWMAA